MRRIELLDYARFFAATFVVLFHYTFNGIQNGKISSISHIPELIDFTRYGYLGVEFFFMISGYVIFFSVNRKSAGQFVVSRAVRLFPAFWAALIFTSCVAAFWGGTSMAVSPPQIIANITMFPQPLGYDFVDGVYWTLQYEWKFYLLVTALLVFGLRRFLPIVLLYWPIYIACAHLAGLPKLPYANGYVGYFAAGALFAMFQERREPIIIFSILVSLYLCVTFSISMAGTHAIEKGVEFSGSVVGSIVAVFFIFFAAIGLRRVADIRLPGAKLAGALTYPVYLVHAHFGYMFVSKFATEENKIGVYIAAFAIVLAVSYGIHTLVEKRLTGLWHSLFSRTAGRVFDWLENAVGGLVLRRKDAS